MNLANDWALAIALVLSNVLTAGLSSHYSRHKIEAEVNKAEIDTVEKAIKIWRELASDLKKENKYLLAKVEQMEVMIQELKDELHLYKIGKKIPKSSV